MSTSYESKKTNNKHFLLTINLPDLIRTNQYYQLASSIKNYEDTLQKFFSSTKTSSLLEDPFVFLWKVKKDEINNDLFPHIKHLNLDEFGISFNDAAKDIIVTGPYVRSYFNSVQNYPIRKELYIYRYGSTKWKDIIDLDAFTETDAEYTLETNGGKICLIKKKYKSPAHVLLQHNYLKRIGWINGTFYVSSMFMIEYQKHITLFDSTFRDPVYNFPYDPLDIYRLPNHNRTHPIKIIESVDIDQASKIKQKDFDKLYEIKTKNDDSVEKLGKKTCIEYCLEKYMREQHPIILNQMKHILIHFNQHRYRRPQFLYAKMLGYHEKLKDIYSFLINTPNAYNIEDTNFVPKTVDEIDTYIIDHCIRHDNPDWLIDYVEYIGITVNSSIVNLIIKYNSIKILTFLIKNEKLDTNLIYYACLMTQEIDLFKMVTFDIDIAINYLKDCLEKSKIRSFYFLYEMDNTICNVFFEHHQNVLHQIRLNHESKEMTRDLIKLILEINPALINLVDDFNETPVLFHAIHNPNLIPLFLEHDFDSTILDNDGNSFLHHLCKHHCVNTMKLSIKKYSDLINLPNKNGETPAIISCINSNEDIFYTLRGMGADMNTQDIYGNTVYHYICKNSLCLAMIIENKKNSFGLTPADYCQLSHKYYEFV